MECCLLCCWLWTIPWREKGKDCVCLGMSVCVCRCVFLLWGGNGRCYRVGSYMWGHQSGDAVNICQPHALRRHQVPDSLASRWNCAFMSPSSGITNCMKMSLGDSFKISFYFSFMYNTKFRRAALGSPGWTHVLPQVLQQRRERPRTLLSVLPSEACLRCLRPRRPRQHSLTGNASVCLQRNLETCNLINTYFNNKWISINVCFREDIPHKSGFPYTEDI